MIVKKDQRLFGKLMADVGEIAQNKVMMPSSAEVIDLDEGEAPRDSYLAVANQRVGLKRAGFERSTLLETRMDLMKQGESMCMSTQ